MARPVYHVLSRGEKLGAVMYPKNAFKLKALFAHLFTNKTTSVDGTRYLVNEGEGDNAVMHTGQGAYFNGVDNYIPVESANVLTEFTLLFGITTNSSQAYNRVFSGGLELLFDASGNDLALRSGDIIPFKVISGYNQIALSSSGGTVEAYSNGTYETTITPLTTPSLATQGVIGARTNFASALVGILQNFLAIPKALTAQEIQAHYNNPEQTLYWDNGVLKSDILDQATIDAMQAGNGFWYPMPEKVSAGGYYRNHALAIPSNKVSEDFNLWTQPNGNWTVNEDGSATMGFIDSWTPLIEVIESFSVQPYVVEIKLSAVSGEVRLVEIDSGGGVSSIASNISTNGTFRYVYTPADLSKDGIALGRQVGSGGGGCTIDNVKVYPLANSGLTPLVNWTSTTTTNAQQLTTGYQCALVEQDGYGLPISLKNYNIQVAEGGSLIDLNNAANPQGLNFVDNAGTLEVYKQ